MNFITLSELLQALCDLSYLTQQRENAYLVGDERAQDEADSDLRNHALEMAEIWNRLNRNEEKQ